MHPGIATSQEARDLYTVLDQSPVAFAYYDMSDRLRFWNHAYENLNFRVRHLIKEGVVFADLLGRLVAEGQIDVPVEKRSEWMVHRLARRRQGGTDFRYLSDGRAFLVQERHDELGGTLGFWTNVTHLFADGVLRRDRDGFAADAPSLADFGCQNVMREHLQAVLAPLELLWATEHRAETLALVREAVSAVEIMTSMLDNARFTDALMAAAPTRPPPH